MGYAYIFNQPVGDGKAITIAKFPSELFVPHLKEGREINLERADGSMADYTIKSIKFVARDARGLIGVFVSVVPI